MTLVWTSFQTCLTVLKDALVTGMGEARGGECREGLSGMSSEGQRIWNIKIDWAASSFIASSFTFLMIYGTTHLNSASDLQ